MISILKLFEFAIDDGENIFFMKGPRGRGYGQALGSKINAPMFAWSVYHDGAKPPFIPGNTNWHPKYQGNTPEGSLGIDAAIPIKPLYELNKIRGIKIRASCQGHPSMNGYPEMNTYIIFMTDNQSLSYVKGLIDKLNKHKDIKAGFGKGNYDRFRIAIVAPFYYDSNPTKFKKWWNELPKILKKEL